MIKNTPNPNFKRTKMACYTAYFTMSSIFALPPILLAVFHDRFAISYTLLGTLVLINFCTQLGVDLLFTFFPKRFNIRVITRAMPLMTSTGLFLYAILPVLFPGQAYAGLVVGTVIFSVSAGLSESLLSPIIAAIPSENPGKDMSLLHSLYAFGLFTVIVLATLGLRAFGEDSWSYIVMFFAALPIMSAVMFMISPIPEISSSASGAGGLGELGERAKGLALLVGCIFFGSCAEGVMTSWISGFADNALLIDKTLGDVLGTALFAILLGAARIAYSKFGKSVSAVLITGMAGAAVCYVAVTFISSPAISLAFCVLTGIFVAMLWPGALILMEEKMTGVGVTAYALMAAGGDLGASVAPQLMGIVVDAVSASDLVKNMAESLGVATEQIGMKAGMLVSSLFPIAGLAVLILTLCYFKKKEN